MDIVFIRHLLEDFSDNRLCDYFFVDRIVPQKYDADYYTFSMTASPAFQKDVKFEPGMQKRLLFAMYNSCLKGHFHGYGSGTTDLRLGMNFADDTFAFEGSCMKLGRLDKSGYGKLDLFSGKNHSMYADFRATMNDKGVSLFFHKKNTLEEIIGYLRLFIDKDIKLSITANTIESMAKQDSMRRY